MTVYQISKTLSQLGWELEEDLEHKPLPAVRARCGGFYTPYRALAETVLNDVLMIKAGQNAEAVGKQNPHPNGRYASIEKGGV